MATDDEIKRKPLADFTSKGLSFFMQYAHTCNKRNDMDTSITKAFIRERIRQGYDLNGTIGEALLNIKAKNDILTYSAFKNEIAFSPDVLYELMKKKGYVISGTKQKCVCKIKNTCFEINRFTCSLPAFSTYSRVTSFNFNRYMSMGMIEAFVESLPQIEKNIKEAIDYITDNFAEAANSVAATDKSRSLRAGMTVCFLKNLLDNKGLEYNLETRKMYTNLSVTLPGKRMLKYKIFHAKFNKDRETVIKFIEQSIDLLTNAPVELKLK